MHSHAQNQSVNMTNVSGCSEDDNESQDSVELKEDILLTIRQVKKLVIFHITTFRHKIPSRKEKVRWAQVNKLECLHAKVHLLK